MLFFIDTADVEEIRHANAMGLVDGVTTNASTVTISGTTDDAISGVERVVINGGVDAFADGLKSAAQSGRKMLQTGQLQQYLLGAVFFVAAFVVFYIVFIS